MQLFDEYLKSCEDEKAYTRSHSTIRTIMIPDIINLICQHKIVDEATALDIFYNSATGASYADDDTGLYGQSALFVYGLFAEEINENSNNTTS